MGPTLTRTVRNILHIGERRLPLVGLANQLGEVIPNQVIYRCVAIDCNLAGGPQEIVVHS